MKDYRFLTIGYELGRLLNDTKWWQLRKRKLLEKGIMAAYFDYQGHHELSEKILPTLPR